MKWAAAGDRAIRQCTYWKSIAGTLYTEWKPGCSRRRADRTTAEDIEVITDEIPGYEIAGKGTLTVALDISITETLQNEGMPVNSVNRVQNIRKDNNFELTETGST